MPDKIPDLWPHDLGLVEITTPLLILKTQGTLIAEKTRGVVEGRVQSTSTGSVFVHYFQLVAPALGYAYQLLAAQHDIRLYPLSVKYEPNGTTFQAADEGGFTTLL